MESFRLLATQGRSPSRFFRNPGLNLLLSIQEVGVAWEELEWIMEIYGRVLGGEIFHETQIRSNINQIFFEIKHSSK